MWIPTPLYKRAPRYWLFLGLLLVVTSAYLALQMNQPFYFIGAVVGLGCCVWSAMTSWKRSLYSEGASQGVADSAENA